MQVDNLLKGLTQIKEPFLLLFGVCWIVFCYLPIEIRWRGSRRMMKWPERVVFSWIGFVTLLLWYSSPPK